jgi:hypothetical protein
MLFAINCSDRVVSIDPESSNHMFTCVLLSSTNVAVLLYIYCCTGAPIIYRCYCVSGCACAVNHLRDSSNFQKVPCCP